MNKTFFTTAITIVILCLIIFPLKVFGGNDFNTSYGNAIELIKTNPGLAREHLKSLIAENPNKELTVLSNIAICYWLEKNIQGVRDIDKEIFAKSNQVTQYNFKVFVQAACFLYFQDKENGLTNNFYLDKVENVLNKLITEYPDSKVSEQANCMICYCEILKGNIIEAKKMATKIKDGRYFILTGYLYSGICDEYNHDYLDAEIEYQNALKIFPNKSRPLKIYLRNLKEGKNNLSSIFQPF